MKNDISGGGNCIRDAVSGGGHKRRWWRQKQLKEAAGATNDVQAM